MIERSDPSGLICRAVAIVGCHKSILMNIACLYAILVALCMRYVSAGFTFISGDDSDDANHCETASSCGGLMVTIFEYAISLSTVPSAVTDVVGIGIGGGNALSAFVEWQTGANFTADIITTESEIANTDFSNYKVVYLPSNALNVGGGITCSQLDMLSNRSSDVINFVNVLSGSLIALTHEGCSSSYEFLAAPLETVSISTASVYVEDALLDIVPTLTPTSLDHCCYHTAYPGPIGYGGLNILATNPSDGNPIILGGLNIILSAEICDDGIDNDGDGLIDSADPECAETNCADGRDNNLNGYADCDDPNCQTYWPPCVHQLELATITPQSNCQGSVDFTDNFKVMCEQIKNFRTFEFYSYTTAVNSTRNISGIALSGQTVTEDTMINCKENTGTDFGGHQFLRVNGNNAGPEGEYAMLQKFSFSDNVTDVLNSSHIEAVVLLQKGSGFGKGNASVYAGFRNWTEHNASCSSLSRPDYLDWNCSHVPPTPAFSKYGWTIVNVTEIYYCQYDFYQQQLNLVWTQDSLANDGQVWHSSESLFPPMLIFYYS